MLNHGGAASNTDIQEQAFGATPASATTPMQTRDFFKAANQSLVFTAVSDIEAGQPVTFNYTRTNVCLTLVLVWGFYSQGCTNSIVLTVPLAPNEVSKQHLVEGQLHLHSSQLVRPRPTLALALPHHDPRRPETHVPRLPLQLQLRQELLTFSTRHTLCGSASSTMLKACTAGDRRWRRWRRRPPPRG